MNEVFCRRLVGLAVLLALVFLLSLLLPGTPAREEIEPSTTISLSGEPLQVTEADAVPPPDDYTRDDGTAVAESGIRVDKPASAAPEIPISDLSGSEAAVATEPPPQLSAAAKSPAPIEAVKSAGALPATKPPVQVVTPLPKLSESLAKPPRPAADNSIAGTWYVQIGSFSELGTATTIVSLIRKQGYRGEVSKISGAKGKTLHRVRAGPYPSEAAARSAQARIATQGYPQARVVSEASR